MSTQDKEGFIAPKPTLQQDNAMNKGREEVNDNDPKQEPPRTKTMETVHYYHVENKDPHEERRLQIEELDEWKAHKPRTHDKPKLRQNEFDTSLNLLKVGDKVLLDAADPHIVNTNPNGETPLTVLSIFSFGTVEVSHPKFGTFKNTQPCTRACLKPWQNRGRDTAMQYGRVKAGHDFPKTRDVINPHGCATWPWMNLISEHGRARGKARFFFFDTGHQAATSTGQTSPQGISSMLSMKMIKRRRGTSPQHEDPPTQPPPPSRPVHAVASYADISECLTRFQQQCFQ
ncbi:hypothetical protein GOBAR_AA37474 [Gossypium barbadense]|uniref:Uncharacterized protein n=1 Tax=Gossypium barbadense TaxID=3634 RepID=A0A2P5VWQ2_GOSBA|nr:hypothetical protein GOBAR_AA37474 [Gossypium barbadense]